MKRIAVVGSNGFVGKNLVEFLTPYFQVTSISRQIVDLLNTKQVQTYFEKHDFDVVIYCANQGGTRKSNDEKSNVDICKNNLMMFFNVFRTIDPQKTKFFQFGSGAEYNKAKDLVQVKEDAIELDVPQDAYGFSKYIMAKTTERLANVYTPIIFGLYGQYEDYSFKFISNAILKNILKQPIVISQNVTFDYLYIEDFLRIMKLYIQQDYTSKRFNITPTHSINLIEIAQIINGCSTYKSEIVVKNPGINFEYTGDNQRMLSDIGSFTFTSYQEGIEKLYQYYLKHFHLIDTAMILNDAYAQNCKIINKE